MCVLFVFFLFLDINNLQISETDNGFEVKGLPPGVSAPMVPYGSTIEQYRTCVYEFAESLQATRDNGVTGAMTETYKDVLEHNKEKYKNARHETPIHLLQQVGKSKSAPMFGKNLTLIGALNNREELMYMRSAALELVTFIDRIIGDTMMSIDFFEEMAHLNPLTDELQVPDVQPLESEPTEIDIN